MRGLIRSARAGLAHDAASAGAAPSPAASYLMFDSRDAELVEAAWNCKGGLQFRQHGNPGSRDAVCLPQVRRPGGYQAALSAATVPAGGTDERL